LVQVMFDFLAELTYQHFTIAGTECFHFASWKNRKILSK